MITRALQMKKLRHSVVNCAAPGPTASGEWTWHDFSCSEMGKLGPGVAKGAPGLPGLARLAVSCPLLHLFSWDPAFLHCGSVHRLKNPNYFSHSL